MMLKRIDIMVDDKITREERNTRDRRSGLDRRHFSYYCHIPERRSGGEGGSIKDRRNGSDRRNNEGS